MRNPIGTVRELRRQVDALQGRMRELEDEVQECRAVNLRVAELADVVTALLVPLAQSDATGAREVLERYHRSL